MAPPAGPGGPMPYGWPPAPRRSNRTAYLLAGIALVCVLALVVGGVVWWRTSGSSEGTPDLVAGQLTGSYPSAPTAQWSISATSRGGSAFLSIKESEGRYGTVGAATHGDMLITIVGEQFTSVGTAHRLVGINARTGDSWLSARTVQTCSDTIVAHRIACTGEGNVYFIDVRSGRVTATVPSPTPAVGVAFNGDAAFMSQYVPTTDSVVFHKITESGVEWSRDVGSLPVQALGSGDSSSFTATEKFVASSSLRALAVSADDGKPVVTSAGTSEIGRFADGTLVLETGTVSGTSWTDRRLVVLHPDGTTSDIPGENGIVPNVATPSQATKMLVDGRYADVRDGGAEWSAAVPDIDPYASTVVLADDREVVLYERSSGAYVALDTQTGQQRWSAISGTFSGSTGHAITDGERLIMPAAGGGISAVDLESGSPTWSLASNDLGNVAPEGSAEPPPALTFAVGDRLVTVTPSTITGFAPTGPAAITPGTSRAGEQDSGDGGPTYVTPCGSAPTFTPESFQTSSGGLAVRMKVTAQCPGGDVLFGPQTRITITDDQGLVASGNFDFERSPVAVPSLDDAGGALTLDLTYPPGTFFRLPDTLGAEGSGTTGGSSRYLVDCDKGPTSVVPPRLSVPESGAAASSTSTGPSFPAGANVVASSVNALRVQADSDRAFILANLNNRWVAQLSSKRPGLVAEGRTWDDQAILDEFLALRLRFNDVRLLWSDEWPVFSDRGWWVTVAAATFPGPEEANNWCRSQGFTPDNCFAKLVSSTAGPDGTTRYWR